MSRYALKKYYKQIKGMHWGDKKIILFKIQRNNNSYEIRE